MLNVNQSKVEQFYDVLDESTMMILEHTKKSYLECLLLTCTCIDEFEVIEELETIENNLTEIYTRLDEETFNKEEIRKAFQLALLKGFKHLNFSFNEITPDTIGILMSYFVDKFFSHPISILDTTVGTGNLLFSLLNNSECELSEIYGVDQDSAMINIAYTLSNVLEYEVQFINQNNLTPLVLPLVDLVISDLPITDDFRNYDLNTRFNEITYNPYLMVESHMNYCKEGGYFIYLIPNDFFNHNGCDLIKRIILENCFIQAVLELPESMFKTKELQKSILILRKRGTNILPTKEILMLSFPSFTDTNKVKNAIDKINQWFNNINR